MIEYIPMGRFYLSRSLYTDNPVMNKIWGVVEIISVLPAMQGTDWVVTAKSEQFAPIPEGAEIPFYRWIDDPKDGPCFYPSRLFPTEPARGPHKEAAATLPGTKEKAEVRWLNKLLQEVAIT